MSIAIRASMAVVHSCLFVASLAAFPSLRLLFQLQFLSIVSSTIRLTLIDLSKHNTSKIEDRRRPQQSSTNVGGLPGWAELDLSPAVASPWRPVGPSILCTRVGACRSMLKLRNWLLS